MASLWRVSDYSTGRMMAEFYKHRTTEGMNKAEALRAVQLAMIDRKGRLIKAQGWQSPYYWAPFVIMGNWR
jgi:CHAT domain-containing protein